MSYSNPQKCIDGVLVFHSNSEAIAPVVGYATEAIARL